MTKQEAKRQACAIVAGYIDASVDELIEGAGFTLEGADYDRLWEALGTLANELAERGLGTHFAPKARRADISRRAVARFEREASGSPTG